MRAESKKQKQNAGDLENYKRFDADGGVCRRGVGYHVSVF